LVPAQLWKRLLETTAEIIPTDRRLELETISPSTGTLTTALTHIR